MSIKFLERRHIARIHKVLFGKSMQCIYSSGLDSALARLKNSYLYGGITDVRELSFSLLIGIARNHPFIDGNKRTALMASHVFLLANGYTYRNDKPKELAELMDSLCSNYGLSSMSNPFDKYLEFVVKV